jgi:hypothetical protein
MKGSRCKKRKRQVRVFQKWKKLLESGWKVRECSAIAGAYVVRVLAEINCSYLIMIDIL